MRIPSVAALARLAVVVFLAPAAAVFAAEIKVISAFGMKSALEELASQFQSASGHKVTAQFSAGVPAIQKINAGESFDVAILAAGTFDELMKQGKTTSRSVIARSGMGLAVRAGAPKPAVESVDAFKQALLNAKSIAYDPQGTTGKHVATVFERLGIAAEMTPKMRPQQGADRIVAALAAGEADFAFVSTATVIPGSGVEVAGFFPRELQDYVVYTAGVSSTSSDPDAAKALIDFLASDNATAVLKAKGLERIAP